MAKMHTLVFFFLSIITLKMYYLCTSRYKKAEHLFPIKQELHPSNEKQLDFSQLLFHWFIPSVLQFVPHRQEVYQIKEGSWSKMLPHGDVNTTSLKKGTLRIISIDERCSIMATSKTRRGRFSNRLNSSAPLQYCPNICHHLAFCHLYFSCKSVYFIEIWLRFMVIFKSHD